MKEQLESEGVDVVGVGFGDDDGMKRVSTMSRDWEKVDET